MITNWIKVSVILIFISNTLAARDLFLTDGRILRAITVKDTTDKLLRVSHENGVAAVSTDVLTRADYYELGVHKEVPAPLPVLAALPPRAPSQQSGYSNSSFGSRDYASRSYSTRSLGFVGSTTSDEPEVADESTNFTGSSYRTPSYRRPSYPTTKYTGSGSSSGTVYVRSYIRKDGTRVKAHTRRR